MHTRVDSETFSIILRENRMGPPVLTSKGSGRIPWGISVTKDNRICVLLDKERYRFGYRGTMMSVKDVRPMSH